MAADDYCYLTTSGRRTGRPHRIEIWYAAADDVLYLLSGGGTSSDWVRNLTANPAVIVELDGAEVMARARVLADGEDEEQLARSLVYAKYAPRSASDLAEWRDRAAVVALHLART